MPRLPSDQEVDAYITQVATRLGIDPRVAVDVSRAERQSRSGGWIGDNGTSFGPFQLHIGGGLGDIFQERTGLDPRNIADTWKQQVDFALQWAKSVSGWEPFHAAQRLGYGVWDGIRSIGGSVVGALTYFFPLEGYSGNPKDTYHTPGASDLFAPAGTPIRDMVDGRVTVTSSSGPGGNSVIIRGLDGLDYYYAHMQDPASVSVGDYVAAGQAIGKVGNTGNAAGKPPHLHIGIGYGIESGTGAAGGAGRNFDAQTFLSQVLNTGGADPSTHGVITGTAQTVSMFDVGGQIRQGVSGAATDALQGIQNFIRDRTASIVLLSLGIFMVLAGVWAFANDSGLAKTIIKPVASMAGGPVVGAAASVA